ncbi:MAG TPA: thiamine phosphate synthase [Ignavibacteria bacterium]|jgi:thiamine-phosphate pyrophosphorylase
MKKIGRLCVITDTSIQKKYTHVDIAEMAIKGGADMIQLRAKEMGSSELINIAGTILKMCIKKNVTFIINDRVDIAMITDADGVHLGLRDIPIHEARRLLGKNKIIGGTAHSLNEACDAQNDGANYIGYGHIYTTYSKHKPEKPKGIKNLKEVVKKIEVPIIAIGGITIENAGDVMSTGCYGIAVISSVVKASDPAKAVRGLKRML